MHKRVYVDFEAVLAAYSGSPLPTHPVPRAPDGAPAKTLSVPAVAPETLVIQGATSGKAEALLEENRKSAVAELSKLLGERYVREVERAGQARIRLLEPAKQRAYEEAQGAIRAEFESYAQKRGQKLARLTSLVGFPDANPLSLPPTRPVPEFVHVRLAEAAQLRKDIAALDDAYQARVVTLLGEAGKQYNVSLSEAQAQIEVDRKAAFARAEQEAVVEAAKSYKSLTPLVMGAAKVNLPGRPAQSVTLPAVPAPIPAPSVKERTLSLDQRRTILKDQLDMWIAVNGYELSNDSDGVPNATAEFIKWRRERKL